MFSLISTSCTSFLPHWVKLRNPRWFVAFLFPKFPFRHQRICRVALCLRATRGLSTSQTSHWKFWFCTSETRPVHKHSVNSPCTQSTHWETVTWWEITKKEGEMRRKVGLGKEAGGKIFDWHEPNLRVWSGSRAERMEGRNLSSNQGCVALTRFSLSSPI